MTKAFAYLRVSGRGQIDGDGFDRQLLACQAYAAVHDIHIVEVFKEEGISGTTELDNRPALSELFAALEENGIKTVLCEKLDRLARDLMIQESIVADMLKHGYTLISSCEPDLCSSDPSRVLIRQIFGVIAQYEKSMIVLKLRGARQRAKARTGRCEGRLPFGAKPGEDTVLAEMRRLASVYSYGPKAIAQALNKQGFRTRYGNPWIGPTITKILAREVR